MLWTGIVTLLVSGPRGAGKTILVNKALKGRNGVIDFKPAADTDVTNETLVEAIMNELEIEYTAGLNPTTMLMKILKDIKPILIVEVNDHCTSEGLQSLLLRLKSWGADKMLVRPIVVVSSSRSAFSLTIGLKELRTEQLIALGLLRLSPNDDTAFS